MIIQCEACKTKFRVGDDKVKTPGIKVRCSKCGEVFFFEYDLYEEHNRAVEHIPFDETEQAVSTPDATSANESGYSPVLAQEPGNESPPEPPGLITTETTDEQPVSAESEETPEVKTQFPIETTPDDHGNIPDTFLNLEIDHLDDMAEKPETEFQEELFKAPPETSEQEISERTGNEFQNPNLVLDQDVLEQTITRGTVASSSEIAQPHYATPSKTAAVRRYSRDKGGSGGFMKRFFTWVLSIVLIGALFLVSMFLLNETKIYPNNYFSRFDSFAKNYYGGNERLDMRKDIRIKNDKSGWENSKYGQVYVVSGEAENTSSSPVNHLKLRIYYISDGTNIFIQELYAGNTLTKKEIKNSSFNSLQAKLNRKNGDISYDGTDNLDGLNFDIRPGEVIPFYSVFPAKEKILGLKYRIELVSYDSAEISEKAL